MENVTLTATAFKLIKKAFLWVVLGFSFLALLVQWHWGFAIGGFEIIRSIFGSVTFAAVIFWVFYKWCWKWGALPLWLGRPVVSGIWIGQLESNYTHDGQGNPLQKEIVFVVRQTYLTLCIQSFTDHQVGVSKVEALIQNDRTDSTRLAYVYELKNEYAGQSTLVNGAGDLTLITKSSKKLVLKGAYWTSTPTQGRVSVHRVSEKCEGVSEFADAVKRWPKGPLWKIPNI